MSKEQSKALKEFYAVHGICVDCGANRAEHGRYCLLCWDKQQQRNAAYKLTDDQKKRKNKRSAERYRELKAKGICVNCAKRKTNGKTTCEICRIARNSRERDREHQKGVIPLELRGHGYCSACCKPITSGKVCDECLERLRRQAEHARQSVNRREHIWRGKIGADVQEQAQTAPASPRIDFNVQGGEMTDYCPSCGAKMDGDKK